LIEAGVVKGRTLTSWPSLKTDLTNAGAKWVDQEVVVDRGLVSSRKPADLPALCRELVEELGEGGHPRPETRACRDRPPPARAPPTRACASRCRPRRRREWGRRPRR